MISLVLHSKTHTAHLKFQNIFLRRRKQSNLLANAKDSIYFRLNINNHLYTHFMSLSSIPRGGGEHCTMKQKVLARLDENMQQQTLGYVYLDCAEHVLALIV